MKKKCLDEHIDITYTFSHCDPHWLLLVLFYLLEIINIIFKYTE